MNNPICTAMNWPVPNEGEILVISVDGKDKATLSAAQNGYSESVYLITTGYGVPNACCSVLSWPADTSSIRAKRALAKKLFANARNLKSGELADIIERLKFVKARIEKSSAWPAKAAALTRSPHGLA